MQHRTITLVDLLTGPVPDELQGVRWPDGTTECRFNVTAADYPERRRADGRHDIGPGEVLVAPTDCDRCADKCG